MRTLLMHHILPGCENCRVDMAGHPPWAPLKIALRGDARYPSYDVQTLIPRGTRESSRREEILCRIRRFKLLGSERRGVCAACCAARRGCYRHRAGGPGPGEEGSLHEIDNAQVLASNWFVRACLCRISGPNSRWTNSKHVRASTYAARRQVWPAEFEAYSWLQARPDRVQRVRAT